MALGNIRIPVLLAVFGVFATAACQAPEPPAAQEAPDYAAELAPMFNTFIEVLNTKDYSKLEGLFAPDFRRVAPDQNANGPDEMAEFIRQIHAVYPDLHVTVGESVYADGLSFNQWTVTGTATGEDGTQTAIEVPGVTMLRYADGMITEEWVYFDAASLMEQLGMTDIPHAE